MRTLFLLMAQYDGKAVVPVDDLCRDYFSHLTPEKFLRKAQLGEILIPVVRIEGSQKAARGVHLQDLASYLDMRRDAAKRELQQMTG
jgi:hypothetical protein